MWQWIEGDKTVTYTPATLLGFLARKLDTDLQLIEEQQLMAFCSQQIEMSLKKKDPNAIPRAVLIAFSLGYQYAKFMGNPNARIVPDISPN